MKFYFMLLVAKLSGTQKLLVPLSVSIFLCIGLTPQWSTKRISTSIGANLKTALCRSKLFKQVLLLLFCITTFCQVGNAQIDLKEHYIGDVIYFKNGGMLHGKILNITDDAIEFRMVTEKVINIKMKIVKKITQKFDETGTAVLKSYSIKPYQFKEQGIYNLTTINLPQGFNEWNEWDSGLGIHHVTGKQFNRWLGAGLGLGFDGYQLNNGRNVLSVYGDFRGYVNAKNFSPYYSVGLGYGFGIKNVDVGIIKAKGGVFFNPTIGYRFGGNAGANLIMGLGYKLQVATFNWNGWNSVNRQRYVFKRLNLSIGVLF